MKRTTKRLLAILLCLAVLPVEGFAAMAKNKVTEPPAYMRELSRLVATTASEDDFGEIQLTIGEPEMEVDGETRPITGDENVVPFVDENNELQIPVEVIDEADLNGSGFLSAEEMKEQGYDVQTDDSTGTVIITEPYQQCRLIVKTTNGKVHNTHGATHVIHVSNDKTVLQYVDKESAAKAAAAFKRDADVLFCATDGICSVSATMESTEYTCWGTEVAGADQFMAGLPDNLPQVTVAVIDTGADMDHPFLEGRLLDGGWDFVNDDDDPDDDHFHGTHCAGIVRDATPDNVKILPIKTLDSGGSGTWSLVVEGMTYAVDNGAEILSMSLGGTGDDDLRAIFDDAAAYAATHGVTAIAAAGNSRVHLDEIPSYPACCDGVFAVAAATQQDTPSSYTNFGSQVDIAAPGDNIVSSVPDGKYRSLSGTSMACPLVAACAALFKTEDANRTPEDLYALLRTHVRDANIPGRDDYTGSGIVYLGTYRPLQGLSLPYSHLTLEPLQGYTLTAEFNPPHPSDCTLTYETTDPSVVYFDSAAGVVKGVGAGEAQIIATSTQGGFTAVVDVTVYGEMAFSQITSNGGKYMLYLQNNHTAYAYGFHGGWRLGYYVGAYDHWPFKYQSDPRENIQDIARFWDGAATTMFTKTDGTVWMGGNCIYFYNQRRPVQTMIDEHTPMTDAVDIQGLVLLRRDGTLWKMPPKNDPYWQPVEYDGKPLTGIRTIRSSYGWVIAVAYDGSAYEIALSHSSNQLRRICDNTELPITGIKEVWSFDTTRGSRSFTILLQDGTVIDPDRNVLMRNVSTISAQGNGTVMALKKDGTVWNVTTGEQVMEAPDAPLTNVVQLCAGTNWHFARCADGTVRAWGMNGEFGNPESTVYMNLFGTMGVGWMDAKVVEHPKESTVGTQPLREKSADDLTYISVTTAPSVTICETPYAIPVMENETTPLSNVADVRCSGSQALFEKTDGSMHWSGAVQNLSLGDYPQLKMAVYAIPMQFFGAQVYLRQSSEPSPYSTERAQAIRLDKPAAAAVVGDTFHLTATLTPADTYERNIRWKSSDTNIATVDSSGVVTAKAVGVTTIRAYITSNSKVWGQCLLSVEEEAPKSVALRQAPTRRSYTTADTALDTSGGSLLLTYPNGQQRGVSISPDYCTGYDFTRTGEQTVTITFGGETFTYTITVADAAITPPAVQDKTVTDIRWEKYPDGCVGLLGGRFVVPDASIRILYADGSYALVPLTAEMCSGMDMEKAGTQSVTVTCEGFTLLFSLTLLPRIRWEGYPAVGVGVVGGSFVVPDASVCVQNEDGSTVILPLTAEMCSGYDMQKPGIQTVTVTVDGYTLSYSLKLLPRLSWISEPAKITIAYGDPLTVPGASFLVYQDDGSSEVISLTPEMCTGFDPYTYGIQTVEVPYAGDVLTFPVTVGLEGVTSVAVEMLPAKRCYKVFRNTWPDVTGGTLRVTFTDGTAQIIPMSEATVRYTPKWAGTFSTVEPQTVYLDYGGQTTAYSIHNLGCPVTEVEEAVVTKLPNRLVFSVEEQWSIDLTGGRIYARTVDGAEGEEDMAQFSDSFRYPWNTSPEPGNYELGIEVGNKRVYVPITIVQTTDPDDPNPDDPDDPDEPQPQTDEKVLVWSAKPSKTVYCVGEELDVSDASFYIGRSIVSTDLNPEMCHVDMSTAGYKTVFYNYEKTTADGVYHYGTLTYDIVVCDLVLENEVPEIEVGKCTRILASFTPRDVDGREIIWSSSDETIATVDAYGRVTGIAPGEVEITAQVKDSDAAASCIVKVLGDAATPELSVVDGSGAEVRGGFIFGLPAGVTAEGLADYLTAENGSLSADHRIGTGTVVQLLNVYGEAAAEYTVVIFGDLNGDGMVNSTDVTALRSLAAGLLEIEPDGAVYSAADVNGDGLVNSTDLTVLRRQAAGLV